MSYLSYFSVSADCSYPVGLSCCVFWVRVIFRFVFVVLCWVSVESLFYTSWEYIIALVIPSSLQTFTLRAFLIPSLSQLAWVVLYCCVTPLSALPNASLVFGFSHRIERLCCPFLLHRNLLMCITTLLRRKIAWEHGLINTYPHDQWIHFHMKDHTSCKWTARYLIKQETYLVSFFLSDTPFYSLTHDFLPFQTLKPIVSLYQAGFPFTTFLELQINPMCPIHVSTSNNESSLLPIKLSSICS